MWLEEERQDIAFYRRLPETPAHFVEERTLADMMLAERSQLYGAAPDRARVVGKPRRSG